MDLTPFRELTVDQGPFASVYLDASHDSEDAAKAIELRWRQLRDQLAGDGADQDTLAALDEAVTGGQPATGRSGRVLIAAQGRVLLDRMVPDPPPVSTARYTELPDLEPLVLHAEEGVRHVVAVVDRLGADLSCFDELGNELDTETVQGREHPAHKVGGGGWAHRRLQQRVEGLVEQNAAKMAAEIDRLVREHRAELLVLAGEVQARTAVAGHLTPACRDVLVELDFAARAAGNEPDALADAVRLAVAEQVAQRRQEVVERFRAESQRDGGLAAVGLKDVIRALRAGQADTVLLVRDAGSGERTDDTERAALLCASAGTGAQVQVTEPGEVPLPDGVGALLRYRT
jgi:hypothetical protein